MAEITYDIFKNQLYLYYINREFQSLHQIHNFLLSEEIDKRFGVLNSAFLEIYMLYSCDSNMMTWYKDFQRNMCDDGILIRPEWMNNRQEVEKLQSTIRGLII